MGILVDATKALGGTPEFSLVLLNEASAYPHGSEKPQTIRNGSVVLLDTGCSVFGYQSDISRTWIFGEPSARQREIWSTVKRGRRLRSKRRRSGVPFGAVDKARARAFYEGKGWSKGLRPARHLASNRPRHRHGSARAAYLVRSDTTPLEAACVSRTSPESIFPASSACALGLLVHEPNPVRSSSAAVASIDQPF